jgi:hypothetical protein
MCAWLTALQVLGGSSALNFMVWDRASAIEYDAWERLGNSGWVGPHSDKTLLKFSLLVELEIDVSLYEESRTLSCAIPEGRFVVWHPSFRFRLR